MVEAADALLSLRAEQYLTRHLERTHRSPAAPLCRRLLVQPNSRPGTLTARNESRISAVCKQPPRIPPHSSKTLFRTPVDVHNIRRKVSTSIAFLRCEAADCFQVHSVASYRSSQMSRATLVSGSLRQHITLLQLMFNIQKD